MAITAISDDSGPDTRRHEVHPCHRGLGDRPALIETYLRDLGDIVSAADGARG